MSAAAPPPLDLPRIIGHRGAAALAPENTLAGIRLAHELGAGWVEFDVKLSSDGVPILMHDDKVDRTTDGRGRVREKTLAELGTLDAGAWFDPAFAGERVPTLEAALTLADELGLGLNVEIKPCPGKELATTRAALQTIDRLWPKTKPAPLISSFAPDCLALALELAPDLPRGYLAQRLPRSWRSELRRYRASSINLGSRLLQRSQIDAVKAEGVPLLVYTVNDPKRAEVLLEAGVSAIFTDEVATIVRALGRG
jgi:glycerophosphoryl diester phosphodiesterase